MKCEVTLEPGVDSSGTLLWTSLYTYGEAGLVGGGGGWTFNSDCLTFSQNDQASFILRGNCC